MSFHNVLRLQNVGIHYTTFAFQMQEDVKIMYKKDNLLSFSDFYLRHGLGQLFAAEQMEVQVLDRLTAILPAIGDHAVTVG